MRWVRPSGRRRYDLPPRARGSAARAYEHLRSRVHEQLARLVDAGGPTRTSIGKELQLRPGALQPPADAVRALAPDADDVAMTLNTDADGGHALFLSSRGPSRPYGTL
jgi:hypothetical protein